MAVKNAYDVLVALRDQISRDAKVKTYLGRFAKTIGINQAVNEDPTQTPWLGLYMKRNRMTPDTTARGWNGDLEVTLVAQAHSTKSGDDCVQRLETITQHVLYAIIQDTTLSGNVEAITDIDISYTATARSEEETFFQVSLIDFVIKVKSHGR